MPSIQVLIPDMVRYELTRRIDRPGAIEALEWIRANEAHHVAVRSTEEYEEFLVLRRSGATQGRCELAAGEVLGRELERGNEQVEAIILLCDESPPVPGLLARLPDHVLVLSTAGYLDKLKNRRVKPLADAILQRFISLGRMHRG
jgi:hypothetical protein